MTEQSTAAATQTTDAAAANAESTTAATIVTDASAKTGTATQATQTDASQANAGTATEVKPEDKPAAVPEKYEFKAPEGTTIDTAMQGEFEGIARELGLSQAAADKLFQLGAKMAQGQQQSFQDALTKQSAMWAAAARNDPEIGGEKFDAAVASARQGLAKFATPELRSLLEETRIGDHPEIVRLFHRIGTSIADDKLVNAASAGGSDTRSLADRLYDHPTSKR